MKKLIIAFILVILAGVTVFLALEYILAAPAAKSMPDVKSRSSNKAAASNVDNDTNNISAGYLSEQSFESMSPLEFLQGLEKSTGVVSVGFVPDGWIKPKDIDELIKLVASDKPCAAVVSPLSSFLPQGGSTVGNEAMFLIDGYKSGKYPPALYSTRDSESRKPGEYIKWWKETAEKKQELYNARQTCDILYLVSDKNPQLAPEEVKQETGIYTARTQKVLEEFTDGLLRRYTIWLDKDAASLIDKDWLYKKSVVDKIPVVLIGRSNTVYAFRDVLLLRRDMKGPKIPDLEQNRDGFCVYRFFDEVRTDNSLVINALSRGFPGKPVLKDVINISRKANDGRQPLKYSDWFSPEQKVQYYYWQLRSDPDDKNSENALIDLLPQISWRVLYDSDIDDIFNVLTWFRERSLEENGDPPLLSLLKSNKGLDGAYAEGYYDSLAYLLNNDPKRFIRLLSTLDQSVVNDLCRELSRYETAYGKETVEKLKSLPQEALSQSEKTILQKLLGS